MSGVISLIHTIKENSGDFTAEGKDNLYDVLASGINEIIEKLAISEYKDGSIKLILFEIWSLSDEGSLHNLQSRLAKLLKKQIIKNIICQYFPAVTRALIYSWSLAEPHEAKSPLHIFLLKVLKRSFLKSHTKNPTIARKMLPRDAQLKIESRQLIRIVECGPGRSRTEILQLK